MLRALLAALTVQGDALTGWTPNSAFYPLLKHALPIEGRVCHYGSDGACSGGDTKDFVLAFPDPDDEPLYSPVRLVLELELCTEDDLWNF